MSRDVISAVSLLALIVSLMILGGSVVAPLAGFTDYCLHMAEEADFAEAAKTLGMRFLSVGAGVLAPVFGLMIGAGVLATLAQTKLLVTTEPIKPKFEKISPLKGFKRLFSVKSLIETFKNLLKVMLLLILIYSSLSSMVHVVPLFLNAEIGGAAEYLFEQTISMLFKVFIAFAVLAAADFLYQRWSFDKEMRMTKHEVKEEYKQVEGDPKIKGKIKEKQREMAMSRMMQQVPQADVVIRNPTHVAVAMRYHPGEDDAPYVLAMGLDALALRIVSVAEENGITVIENVPLARALYDQAELNRQIPPSLYEAVAEVMIYLYKLGKLKGTPKADG